MESSRTKLSGCGLAVVLLLIVVTVLAILLPALAPAREAARRASCQNNLKQLGTILKMFANENNGCFPPLSPVRNNWMFDVNKVYPDYMQDPNILICPSSPLADFSPFSLQRTTYHPGADRGQIHPDCVSSLFYIYTSYAIVSDEQAIALFNLYQQQPGAVIAHQPLDVAAPVFDTTDGQAWDSAASGSDIPVIWDRIFPGEHANAHMPPGGNILFMDGHVEFVRYSYYNASDFFPMTRVSVETFGSVLPTLPSDCYPLQ